MPFGIERQIHDVTKKLLSGNRLRVSTATEDDNIGGVNSALATIDAFARQRMSMPTTIFDSKQIFDNLPLFWDDQETSGAGTSSVHSTDTASSTLGVSLNTAGTRVRQTFRRFNYQPGKSQLAILTGNFVGKETGITRRIGLFDENNGMFFEEDDTTFYVVIRSGISGSPIDTTVAQADWNIDKMDGTGTSGITLDTTKSQIYFIDFEWLGVGQVRFGIYAEGAPIYVHAVSNFNTLDTVYISTPNLPLRYEISNNGTGAAAILVHLCSTVITEGGMDLTGITRNVSRAASLFTTQNDADIYPLLSIRLKSTHLGATVFAESASVLCTTTSDYEIMYIVNPDVAGSDAASWVALPNSAIEYDISRNNTNKLTGGTVIGAAIGSDSNQAAGVRLEANNLLAIGSAIDGTPDEVVLAVRRLTGATESFLSNINLRELI